MNRKIKAFIVCSVLLNLLLAGVIVGRMAHVWGMKDRTMQPPEIAGLSDEKQTLIHATMGRAFEESKAIRATMREAREETMRIFSAEPFDEAAYQAQVEKMMALHRERRQHMADAFKELAKSLTPEERARVAKAFRQPPGFWRPGGAPQKGDARPEDCPSPLPGTTDSPPPPL